MGNRINPIVTSAAATPSNAGAGINYLIQTVSGDLYIIYIDSSNDIKYRKSIDDGITWFAPVVISGATTAISLSVWYDRWSGISAGLIHIAYTDSILHDTLYVTINTESSDAQSTITTIFAGVSAVTAGSSLSISRARGGNVYCRTQIDAGAEGGFFRLTNANVPNGAWASRTINEALATLDQLILIPGWDADNQDMMIFFWDVSANEISRQLYDDSANSWAETSISTGMVESAASLGFPHFAAVVDLTNSRNLLIAWNGIDTANADLLGWIVTNSAITAFTTPIVLDSTDDQGFAALSINSITGVWYVFYCGKSDGSETYSTSLNVYTKVSRDAGITWNSETLMTLELGSIRTIFTIPVLYFTPMKVVSFQNASVEYILSTEMSPSKAKLQIGL